MSTAGAPIQSLVSVEDIHTYYGKSHILHGVSLTVGAGEVVGLLGRNGVGKSTTLKSIMGLVHPAEGRITLAGVPVTNLPAHKLARLGIGYVPEDRRIFRLMTVGENLRIGLDRSGVTEARKPELLDKVFSYFPVLGERRNQAGGTLSGGEQQMLAIARALMGQPKLLMLDEPSLGLAPLIVKQIFAAIEELNKDGLTVFLVEQNAYHTLKLADRGYVMVNGRITMSGTGAELPERKEVRAAYLEGDTAVLKETNGA
jgi:branched-chain amino acid transport system ATP-binding protein